jgi:flagellar M-ring protein FliF
MDQLRRAIATIQAQASKLSPSQKLLMISLSVVLAMTMFIVSQYASSKTMIELMPGADPASMTRAVEFLSVNNIRHEMRDGRPWVVPDRKFAVLAQMGESGSLPADTTFLFNDMIEQGSWTDSTTQRKQYYNLALQNTLASIIAEMHGIRKAQVLIDAPEPTGLGMATRKATASATVFPTTPGGLSQSAVDAIAGLIAGAVAGLDMAEVRVIDGLTNRQRRARNDEDMATSDHLETVAKYEQRFREKIIDHLAYIPGVIVSINASVDVRQVTSQTQAYLPSGEGSVGMIKSEMAHDQQQESARQGAESGVRPNTGLSLDPGAGAGDSFTENESDSAFENKFGSRTENIVDRRGMATRINATVNVPESYFIDRWRRAQGQPADDTGAEATLPTTQDLDPIVAAESERIRAAIVPLVDMTAEEGGAAGVVIVSMIPDLPAGGIGGAMSAGVGGFGGGGGGGGGILASGMVKNVALGGVALLAVFLMAMNLKKVGRAEAHPSAEELVGLPPALKDNVEMFGEADEAESNLTGIELSDDDLQMRKKHEQVSSLVSERPSDAAFILNKWISSEL